MSPLLPLTHCHRPGPYGGSEPSHFLLPPEQRFLMRILAFVSICSPRRASVTKHVPLFLLVIVSPQRGVRGGRGHGKYFHLLFIPPPSSSSSINKRCGWQHADEKTETETYQTQAVAPLNRPPPLIHPSTHPLPSHLPLTMPIIFGAFYFVVVIMPYL